jgi:hypothetical protein
MILYEFYKPLDQEVKNLRIYFYTSPWNFLNLHNHAIRTSTKVHGDLWLHNHALPRWGKLVGGEVGPGKLNKQGENVDRAHMVLRLGFQRNAGGARPLGARGISGGG